MRVLVVEDETVLAASLKKGLEADGFAVDTTGSGAEGLWMAQHHRYDVVVLDLMLPGLNGYEICERLRAAQVWTPIMMLTASDGELDEAEALDIGADDFLTKPVAHVVLVARLRALMRRVGRARPAVLVTGDLRLDPARRRCWRGDCEIALTAREHSVLEFLMRHSGDVVSKQLILDHVWDEAFDGDPNIVEVYVRYLRKKVDLPFGRASIETVRGAGYRLVADDR